MSRAPREKATLREKGQTNSRACRRPMTREDGEAPGGLNHLVQRNAEGALWMRKEVTVVLDSLAKENVMPRSLFPEIGIRATERSKNGKGFQRLEGKSTSRNTGSMSSPSGPLKDTDDEDMEDDETEFDDGRSQVRNIRDTRHPTANECKEHMATHRPYRSWCKVCVLGRGMSLPQRKSDAQEDMGAASPMSSLGLTRPEWRVECMSCAMRKWYVVVTSNMPRAITIAADLCMFGLVWCDADAKKKRKHISACSR